MSPFPSRHGRGPRRLREESEEDSFGSLPDEELLSMIAGGGFSAEDSCEAVEEALKRGLESPEAVALMRDLLFGFEAGALRYRAAVCLARLDCWDDDVRRALCHAVAKLPVDEPLARSARLQLQKRGFSPGDSPERPRVGGPQAGGAPAREAVIHPEEAREDAPARESEPQLPISREVRGVSPTSPQSITALPRYTTEDVEEPRLRYRRRKRKRGEGLRQVIGNLQMVLIFVVAFVLFLLVLGRF